MADDGSRASIPGEAESRDSVFGVWGENCDEGAGSPSKDLARTGSKR